MSQTDPQVQKLTSDTELSPQDLHGLHKNNRLVNKQILLIMTLLLLLVATSSGIYFVMTKSNTPQAKPKQTSTNNTVLTEDPVPDKDNILTSSICHFSIKIPDGLIGKLNDIDACRVTIEDKKRDGNTFIFSLFAATSDYTWDKASSPSANAIRKPVKIAGEDGYTFYSHEWIEGAFPKGNMVFIIKFKAWPDNPNNEGLLNAILSSISLTGEPIDYQQVPPSVDAAKLARSRNEKRKYDISKILNALIEYSTSTTKYPSTISTESKEISKDGVDICKLLAEGDEYGPILRSLPIDPSYGANEYVTNCDNYYTGYAVKIINTNNILPDLVVSAPKAELGEVIVEKR